MPRVASRRMWCSAKPPERRPGAIWKGLSPDPVTTYAELHSNQANAKAVEDSRSPRRFASQEAKVYRDYVAGCGACEGEAPGFRCLGPASGVPGGVLRKLRQ